MDKFKTSVFKTYVTAKDKWVSVPSRKRVIILAVAAVIVVSSIILTVILNQTNMEMLVRAADRDEATQIRAAMATAGITESRVNGNNEVFVNERDIPRALVAISEAGLPRPGVNNDVWARGVDMFSTDAVIRETQRQQLQAWIITYLNNIDEVEHSQVILSIPQTRNFVMVQNRQESSAAVRVTLKRGASLNNRQIEGIHLFVRNAVPGLEARNIGITDGNGIPLIPTDGDPEDPWDDLARHQARMTMQMAIRAEMADIASRTLEPMLHTVFGEGDYTVGTYVDMDFVGRDVVVETFTPVVGDSGIIRKIERAMAAGGNAEASGSITGTWGNSDIAPNYPTVPDISAGNDFYIEQVENIDFEINHMVEKYYDDGLRVKNISATVIVNREPMTQVEVDEWKDAIGAAIGTTSENISFISTVFKPTPSNPQIPGDGGSLTRTILIWIIVALGLLLVILFALAITTSSSRKKRLVRARGFVTASEASGYLRDDSFTPVVEEHEGWDLPSLLDENETKDVVLKREIREFTRSHPEIIAQLIRTWLREDDV